METIPIVHMSPKDEMTIDKMVRKERTRLLNFIKSRVRNQDDAEDILQDVFYQFVSGFNAIESIEKATSWLFQVARNKIIDRYRKKKLPEVSVTHVTDDNESIALSDLVPDFDGSPENIYLQTIISERIEESLAEMPKEQRDVFVAHEFENKSFKEIAEITGESVNTLLSRKRYAILFLRSH